MEEPMESEAVRLTSSAPSSQIEEKIAEAMLDDADSAVSLV